MNAVSQKKIKGKIRKNIWRKKIHRDIEQASAWCHRQIIKMPETAALDFIYYISDDFLFSLFYMMTHKRFLHYFGNDYHRIVDILRIFQYLRVGDMHNLVESLFHDIDSEEMLFTMMGTLGYETLVVGDTVYVLEEEPDDGFNPNLEPVCEVYYFSRAVIHNFWMFKQLFYDAVKAFVECHSDKEKYLCSDFWLYACAYLLMGKRGYQIDGFWTGWKEFSLSD